MKSNNIIAAFFLALCLVACSSSKKAATASSITEVQTGTGNTATEYTRQDTADILRQVSIVIDFERSEYGQTDDTTAVAVSERPRAVTKGTIRINTEEATHGGSTTELTRTTERADSTYKITEQQTTTTAETGKDPSNMITLLAIVAGGFVVWYFIEQKRK